MEIIEKKFLDSDTRSVHAASIEFFKDKPVFSWFGGSREGSPDVAIYIDGLDGLEKQYKFDIEGVSQWNPVLFNYKFKQNEEQLILFSKVGDFCDRWNTLVHDISNLDEEKKFDNYRVLPAGFNGPVKTKPILAHQNFCFGSSVETFLNWSSYIEEISCNSPDFMDNVGRTIEFKRKNILVDHKSSPRSKGIIQPSLWVDSNFTVNAFCRSDLGYIYHWRKSFLNDYAKPTRFENPNSGIDTVFHDGFLYLAYNPSKTNRFPLVIEKLDDKFNTVDSLVIEESPMKEGLTQELSYPYMIQRDNKLHLVFTNARCKIEYCVIDLEN